MKKRSNLKVVISLIALVKSMILIMILARDFCGMLYKNEKSGVLLLVLQSLYHIISYTNIFRS